MDLLDILKMRGFDMQAKTKLLKIYDQDVAGLGNEDGTDVGNLAISKSVFFSEVVDSEIGEAFSLEGFRATFQRIQDALTELNTA